MLEEISLSNIASSLLCVYFSLNKSNCFYLQYRISNINYNITNGDRFPIADKSAPVYITVGDGGNQEGLAGRWESILYFNLLSSTIVFDAFDYTLTFFLLLYLNKVYLSTTRLLFFSRSQLWSFNVGVKESNSCVL